MKQLKVYNTLSLLYYIILYYIILYYTILYFIILYYIILYYYTSDWIRLFRIVHKRNNLETEILCSVVYNISGVMLQ